jgi:hypothetical protein
MNSPQTAQNMADNNQKEGTANMSTQLRAQFDGADQAEAALRLLRANGIQPQDISFRTPARETDGYTAEYGAMLPGTALIGAAPAMNGLEGTMNNGGLHGGFIPASIGMFEYSPGGVADMGANGVVELWVAVPEDKGQEARSLMRSAHGWQVH